MPRLKSTGRRFDEPPPTVHYFTVLADSGKGGEHGRSAHEPVDGRREHIVGAADAGEAREIAELIEQQHADHYGDKPWKVVSVTRNESHDRPE